MNSYPHEPLMFVAGLTPSTRDRAGSIASASGQRDRSGSNAAQLEVSHGAPALTTPITSPTPPAHLSLPISPPPTSPPIKEGGSSKSLDQIGAAPASGSGSASNLTVAAEEDEFEMLVRNLREALEGLGGKGKVWVRASERRNFRIMLVDKHVRLPMRKVNPSPAGSQSEPATPHSPLSPLTPTSPLYPDGLIAPIWVRKHAEMVPSVFVLFLRLYESPDEAVVEDILAGTETQDAQRRAKEHEMDEALVKEIGDRRRRLGERGIKLTVVLMASAAALDSPSLDPRLSYLRRASALSSKASLFVLSPVPADQLPEFVQSLQDALFESAAEYYTTHAKRVKRKRARVSTSSLVVPGTAGKVLGGQGWAVRYDWKSGWFAEIRGDLEDARRHYEDCWNELARMFSSTQTLPPRTKRWAEAKVLADCVAMRICRLLLYSDESPKVLGPFFVHLKRFGDLSRGWGIGEETFEFWSWIARQYRIFAELLELGVQAGLRIPTLAPPILPTAQSAAVPPTPEYWSTPISSANPLQTLQSPAFYFYTAASCSVQRQKRFEEALALETDAMASESGAASGYVSAAPGFANEKKVDHSALVTELFTKAYSLLKEQDVAQNRVALYVAYRIAESYVQSGQHDMAMRFFERISTSFRRYRWTLIVRKIRKLWYECAQHTGHVDSAARLLVEMMCPESGIEGEDRAALPEDLMSLLKTTAPASEDPILIEMERDTPLLNVRAGFWQAESPTSGSVPFQISITCPDTVHISEIAFSSAVISFSDGRPDCTIEIADSDSDAPVIDIGTIGHHASETSAKARLRWSPGQTQVIQGTLLGGSEGACEVSSVRLALKEGTWDLQLVFDPEPLQGWTAGKSKYLPSGGIFSVINLVNSPHLVDIKLDHLPSAFVGESIPVTLTVKSRDERDLELGLSVFLHPGEEGEESTISLEQETSISLIKDLDLGILKAGQSIEKIITLKSSVLGTKVIDVSLQTVAVHPETTEGPEIDLSRREAPIRAEEFEATAVIPIMTPFSCSSRVSYAAPRLEEGGFAVDATISTIISGNLVRGVEVETLDLVDSHLPDVEMKATSLALDPFVSERWNENTIFSVVSKYVIRPSRRQSSTGPIAEAPANLSIRWRSNDEGDFIDTALPLPALIFPSQHSFLSARITAPKTVALQIPFSVCMTITNSHPTHSIPDVSINVDASDAFVWMGSRMARLPDIRPNGAKEVRLECVPVSRTGLVELPRMKVYEGQGDGRREIPITGSGKGGAAVVFVQP